jgi:hypothetical protein
MKEEEEVEEVSLPEATDHLVVLEFAMHSKEVNLLEVIFLFN